MTIKLPITDNLLIPWTSPILTGNVTSTSDGDIVCSASEEYSSTYAAWKAMDGNWSATDTSWATNNTSGWWKIKFPYTLAITSITIQGRSTNNIRLYAGENGPIIGLISGSSEKKTISMYRRVGELPYVLTDEVYITVDGSQTVGICEIEFSARKVIDSRGPKLIVAEVFKEWTQPTSITGSLPSVVDLYSYGVGAGTQYSLSYIPSYAFDNDSSTFWASSKTSDWLGFYSPVILKPTKISFTNRDGSQNTWSRGTVTGSLDGTNYFELATFVNNNNTAGATWSITLKPLKCHWIKIDGYGMPGVSDTLGVVQCTIEAEQIDTATYSKNKYKAVKLN